MTTEEFPTDESSFAGLGYQPWLKENPDSTIIRYNMRDPKSYEIYVKQLDDYLSKYANTNDTRKCGDGESNADAAEGKEDRVRGSIYICLSRCSLFRSLICLSFSLSLSLLPSIHVSRTLSLSLSISLSLSTDPLSIFFFVFPISLSLSPPFLLSLSLFFSLISRSLFLLISDQTENQCSSGVPLLSG